MARYTHGHHESVLRSHRWRTADNSAAYLLPHISDGMTVLDVGCGPGTISVDFARRVGTSGSVLGIDTAAAAIVAARDAADAAEVSNVSFGVGDAYAIDAPDESFDIVHAHQVLQHLDRPVDALREMRRVVKKGGWVAARDSDYAAMTWYPHSRVLDRWLDLYHALARRNGGEPDSGRYLLSWARQAGFADIWPSASAWCFATPHDRAWWGSLWAERVRDSAFAEQAIEQGLATPETLAEIADAWQQWSSSDNGWFAVLHGEIRCRR